MSDSQPIYLGLDLETTGLDPKTGRVLEFCAQAYSRNICPVGPMLQARVQVPTRALRDLHPKVIEMHVISGLLKQHEDGTVSQVVPGMAKLAEWSECVDALCDLADAFEEKPLLLGHSVQFDRGWIDHHAPELATMLSHRQMDARSFIQAFPPIEDPNGPKPHRAAEDLMHSAHICRQALALIERGDETWID